MRAEVVAGGVPFGEGPVWCADGTLVVTSVAAGALFRVRPAGRRAPSASRRPAAARNGAALAADGSILVTQNGGFDVGATGFVRGRAARDLAARDTGPATRDARRRGHLPPRRRLPRAERPVRRGRRHRVLHRPRPLPAARARTTDGCSRSRATAPSRLVADGFLYCNGIALDRDGHLVVVEGRGLQRLLPDGAREWVIEKLGRGGGDGFCLDADGRFYVASTIEHGVRVVDADGTIVDFLEIDGDGLTTNCCFGGDDLRTLYATDAIPGTVVAWEGMPTAGLPLPTWPGLLA